MKILSLPQTPRAVADARRVICDPALAASLPETLRRLAFMIVASQHGVQIRQRRQPANDYRLAVVGMKGDLPHPFSSGRAAAQFHLLADDMSPDEASRDPMPSAWQIWVAIVCGAVLGGMVGAILGRLLP